jgi:hypothetical protein
MVASSPDLDLFGKGYRTIQMQKKILLLKVVLNLLKRNLIHLENYFNEENWIIFQTEFEEVVKFNWELLSIKR